MTDRQDASLNMFFKEVSKMPMVDINKEIQLSKRIKAGDEKAVNELVEANLRFVISVAKQYQNKVIPLVDLIQDGNIGLIEAAKRYDESKGFRFISYAVWWIRQSIMHAISSQCRTVRIPMNQVISLGKINKAIERFEQLNGRKPSSDEIVEDVNLSSDKIDFSLASNNYSVSLESPFNDDDAGCLLDVIPNKDITDTDKDLLDESLSVGLNAVLDKLSFRERDTLRMAYGIGMKQLSTEEIANRFGVGCERVRQIQKEAISKIREKYSNNLKDLL